MQGLALKDLDMPTFPNDTAGVPSTGQTGLDFLLPFPQRAHQRRIPWPTIFKAGGAGAAELLSSTHSTGTRKTHLVLMQSSYHGSSNAPQS